MFLQALGEHAFLQYALIAGLLAAVGCGLMGSYVVVKRIGYLAGGIAHAVFGGLGAALFFGFEPMLGALVAAVLVALAIGSVTLVWGEQEDTVIGALWAVGMAVGVLFIAKTPGYGLDLMSLLFGSILMVSSQDLWIMAAMDLLLLVLVMAFYRQFQAVAFDEEFARLRGVPVAFFYLLLLCLVAVTVVLLIRVVGVILVIALLTLPAAIAAQYTQTLGRMMLLATLLGMLFTSGGLALSYAPDLPAGASIILLAGLAYLLSSLGSRFYRRRRALREGGRSRT